MQPPAVCLAIATYMYSMSYSNIHAGADPGRGGLWGLETPPPQYIREAKGMMCCYKNT